MLAPLPESELADGNTLFNIAQRVGGSVGVSILGSLLAGGSSLKETLDSFHLVGAILVGLAALGTLLALFLTRGQPQLQGAAAAADQPTEQVAAAAVQLD
jgi:hypothetical protein